MPIFEYQCRSCGHLFEKLVRRADPATPPTCQKCGAAEVERVLSPFAGRVDGGGGCTSTGSGTG